MYILYLGTFSDFKQLSGRVQFICTVAGIARGRTRSKKVDKATDFFRRSRYYYYHKKKQTMSSPEKSSPGRKGTNRRLFGFMSEKNLSTSDENPVVKKSKSFKKIKGLLTGESRRKKKAQEQSAQKASPNTLKTALNDYSENDDNSTVFGVDVDERSVSTRPNAATPSKSSSSLLDDKKEKTYMLRVVLLLMDPETRRFELLQLEFDSMKAHVSDVLAQIPLSVTEDVLRKQTYKAVCGAAGKEIKPEDLLAVCCTGDDILVAIPNGLPAKECARLARPILSDEKVVAMVRKRCSAVMLARALYSPTLLF